MRHLLAALALYAPILLASAPAANALQAPLGSLKEIVFISPLLTGDYEIRVTPPEQWKGWELSEDEEAVEHLMKPRPEGAVGVRVSAETGAEPFHITIKPKGAKDPTQNLVVTPKDASVRAIQTKSEGIWFQLHLKDYRTGTQFLLTWSKNKPETVFVVDAKLPGPLHGKHEDQEKDPMRGTFR